MKRLVLTGTACFIALAAAYYGIQVWFAGSLGWDIILIFLVSPIITVLATLRYIQFFRWRNAVKLEELRVSIATYSPLDQSDPLLQNQKCEEVN